jgi:portal protein
LSKRKNTDDFLATARARFRQAADAENELRRRMLDDLKFYEGDQWPKHIIDQRKADDRPYLTFNVLQQFIHQISNDIRQNKPAPLIRPVDDKGDIDTAEVLMGLARHVERQSKADVARSYAALYAIITGRGWYRLTTDYESDDSFDQELYVKRIKNQAGVYHDPSAQEPDYSDMGWLFNVEDLTRDEYKHEYPDSEAASLQNFDSIGDHGPYWNTQETIRVAEYFYVEYEDVEIALVHFPMDGSTAVMPLDKVPAEGAEILKTRTVKARKVCYAKINGIEILEERVWPGRWIPFIPVLGEELFIDGKTSLLGMVRGLQSAQQQYNYMRTAQTELIGLAPRNPYIAEESQIEGHEDLWQQANQRNFAVLPYKAVSANGVAVPPPQRQVFEAPIQAVTLAAGNAYEDLKRGSGIHDASLGAKSNESSGRAIMARQAEGDTANFHFSDNLTTAITHETRMEVDLFPKVYDRPGRVARIIGEEDDEKTVILNQKHVEKGVEKIYDLSVGRYDVAVNVGPSYSTKRQAAGEMLMELTRAYPAIMQAAGDLVIQSLDIPGARAVAERLKKMLPPGLQEDGDENEQPVPPKAQAMIASLQQMADALTATVNEQNEIIKSKKIEADSRERIAAMNNQIEVIKTVAQINSKEAQIMLQAELQSIGARLQQLSAAEEAENQRAHEAELQNSAQQAAAAQAQQPQPGAPA